MKKEKIFYFLHDFNPALDYSSGEIISLYPRVSFELETRGLRYKTLGAFYEERDIFRNGAQMFAPFMSWLGEFDAFLQSFVPFFKERGLSLGKLCVSELKYLSDELWIESFIVNKFIESQGPGIRVLYIREARPKTDYSPRAYLRSERNNFLLELLRLIAATHSERLNVELLEHAASAKKPVRAGSPLKAFLKGKLPDCFYLLRLLYRFFYYGKRSALSSKGAVLALSLGAYQMDEILRGLFKSGWKIYGLSDNKIRDLTRLSEPVLADLSENAVFRFDPAQALTALRENDRLYDFFERQTSLPVKNIVAPFLESFVESTVPAMIRSVEIFDKFFLEHSAATVLATSSAGIQNKAALTAAKTAGSKRVCFQHGIHAYRDPLIYVTDLDPFDVFFATDEFSERMYARHEDLPVKPCQVSCSTHYLQKIRKTLSFSRTGTPKKRILYVPTKVISYRRSLSVPTYSVDAYYEYQKKLMDTFKELREFTFIYKQAKTDWKMSYDSIIPYFKNNPAYSNIRLETGHLAGYFPKVDGIIIDRPTTTLFEAAAAGVPFLCLTGSAVSYGMDESMKTFFGKRLCVFSTPEEAADLARAFVLSIDREPPLDFPLSEYDFMSVERNLRMSSAAPLMAGSKACHD